MMASSFQEKNNQRNQQIIELIKQGLTYREIATRFGVSREAISIISKKAGVIKRVQYKLNAEQNQQIIALIKQDIPPKEIAARFGVSRATISLLGKKAGIRKRVRRK